MPVWVYGENEGMERSAWFEVVCVGDCCVLRGDALGVLGEKG